MLTRFTTTITRKDNGKEQWMFAGMGAEKRAFSLLNACTRRKTDFATAEVSRLRHDGTWEVLAITKRSNTEE